MGKPLGDIPMVLAILSNLGLGVCSGSLFNLLIAFAAAGFWVTLIRMRIRHAEKLAEINLVLSRVREILATPEGDRLPQWPS